MAKRTKASPPLTPLQEALQRATTEEERLEAFLRQMRVAGPDDPIYNEGLQMTSIHLPSPSEPTESVPKKPRDSVAKKGQQKR